MTRAVTLSQTAVRRAALAAQFFTGRIVPTGKDGVSWAIAELGYVQLDAIAVVCRAHHHTLWARLPDYQREFTEELLAVDRRIFEYWAHGMSLVPMADYRFYLGRMRGFQDPQNGWARDIAAAHGPLIPEVLARITTEGAKTAREFTGKRSGGGWGSGTPVKHVLELLLWRGELMVTARRNFQKVYDLTERVLPPDVDLRVPTAGELGRHLVRRALRAHGIARPDEIQDYIHLGDGKIIANALRDLSDNDEILPVRLDGDAQPEYYGLTRVIDGAERLPAIAVSSARILSPFDNLLIGRARLRRLFDFAYALECYLPRRKRRFGYFALPVLRGEEFVARIDAKVDRTKKTLTITRITMEANAGPERECWAAIQPELLRFAAFNNCETLLPLF